MFYYDFPYLDKTIYKCVISQNRDYQTLNIDEDVSDREETAPEKRLRLAKDYLEQLRAEGKHTNTSNHCNVTTVFWKFLLLQCTSALHVCGVLNDTLYYCYYFKIMFMLYCVILKVHSAC